MSSAAGPPVTEPVVTTAKLRSILVKPADLPPGFAATPVGVTGDDLLSRSLCGQSLTSSAGATAVVAQVLDSAAGGLRLVEQVVGYAPTTGAARPLAEIRALGQRCHQDGATSVTTLTPPAVGEEVAGLQLSSPTGVIDVAMVRSGPIVVVVVLASPAAIAAASLQQVVLAAGTKLAVGTGG